ncbi:BatD family protein [Aquimarina sp. ERC-38]|uniref:BatD family protein n=1 Tax=Aquimarina sp. ERC-38 TaxID=2949996 RepID=UPI00224569ED|nr:BatD family protein [Aquimarina sp. ERC-38]UZO82015.1 BatD family protein [Aquimarina sp. ERC-38]
MNLSNVINIDMYSKTKKILLTLVGIFLCVLSTLAQVTFEANVSKKKLGVNERLRVDFEMNKDGDNFSPPRFLGFEVVGGPNQSISNSWINGKRSYKKTFSYFLTPTRKGRFTIGQATINIDGTTYKTIPVPITVTSAVSEPKDGNNSEYIASENLHLVAEVSKSNPYLNEAITVVYKLYVHPRIRISNLRELDNPKYSDFWSQSIKIGQLKVERGEYNGEPYNFVVCGKTVLYPQKTGKLKMEPLALTVSVDVPTNRRDIFGSVFYNTVDKSVTANTRTINVKPLPQENRPANFSGAVGSFDFKVLPSRTVLDATESFETRIEVSGQGNLSLFELPKLTVPNGLEKYEPEHAENVRTDLRGMKGSISDRYTLVPQFKGRYPIPPVSFSYFDLNSESYKTINSEEIIIEVKNGPDSGSLSNTTGTTGNAVNKQQVLQSGKQFRFIKTATNLQSVKRSYFFKSTGFWLALTTPLLAIPLFLFFGKKRQQRLGDVQGNRIRKADKLARKYLSEAKRNLGDQKEFYIAMERALHNYLKAKLRIQTSDMSKDRIQRLLKERNVEDTTTIEFIALLESCEFARYTPSSTTAMQQDYDKASRVISSLDKQL